VIASLELARCHLPTGRPSGRVGKLMEVPVDKIIAVKEGTGIVLHPFPKVPIE
jgi:hypothetical protein